ncbi:hypothetical protein GFS60_05086 [Rhodococcus sp. WAY2]|nr:hypothetical protein GFS60_05086 [Rhodococcus sp. WAY2]
MITVDDIVFRASKDFVKGAAAEDPELRVVGGNPHDDRTWWVHAGPCGGTGHCCCPKHEAPRASLTVVLSEAA